MRKRLQKIISLMLTATLTILCLVSCADTGKDTSSTSASQTDNTDTSEADSSDTSESIGHLGKVPDEDEKVGEEIITEDVKQGRVASGMLGASGGKVNEYEGYLGYGYNVLESSYYNYKDVKTSHPVIDMDSLAKDGKVYIEKKTSRSVDGRTFVTSSTKEYSQNLSASASIGGDIGFTGSFETNFNVDYNVQLKTEQKLITTQALLEAQNDYILDVDSKMLAANATDTFKKDVEELTTEALVNKYGTHVLANIALGGRFDLNYLYTKSETSESTDIKVSAEASYNFVKGSTSDEDKEKKKEIDEHSSIIIKSYGGSLTVDPTTIDAAIGSYKEWSEKVDKGDISFVNASEVVSLWDIIANLDIKDAAKKSSDLKTYYDTKSKQISGNFKDSVNDVSYISDIYIGYGKSQASAKTMLRSQGVYEGNIVNLDLNKKAGGYWIYLGYKTTPDKSKALTGIVADYFKNSSSSDKTYKDCHYTIIPTDLNKGARGKFIYIYYTRDPKAGNPISVIKYQDNNTFQYGNADGYDAVLCTSYDNALDLNKGAGGDDVYLWFKRI